MIGVSYKSNVTKMEDLLDKFSSLASSREDVYKFTCICHGDGSDGTNIRVPGTDYVKYGEYYCITVKYQNTRCETTAYFMQYLAVLPVKKYTTPLKDVGNKYESIKWDFIFYAGINKYMDNPHEQPTYYFISRRV